MRYFSYVAIVVVSLAVLPLFIPSEPIVYIAEAKNTIVLEEIVEEKVEERDCSCIVGAREYGVTIPYNTNASDLEPNSPPVIGGLVLLKYPNSDHVAVITDLDAEGGNMEVYEENYNNPEGGCRQGYRNIAWNDPAIRGFWTNQEIDVMNKIVLHL